MLQCFGDPQPSLKMMHMQNSIEKHLMDFLNRDPYSRLKPIARFSMYDLLRCLNWASATEIYEAFYELGLDRTLARPKSVMDVAYEHDIVEVTFLKEFLDSLVHMGVLDEAAGRYKIRFFKKKPKRPKIVDFFIKTPLRAIFEVITLMGENIIDVLMTGKRELNWLKDAAIAYEPLEFSPQMVRMRLRACEILYGYIRNTMWVEDHKKAYILNTGLASGYGIVNIAQFFRDKKAVVIGLDISDREVNLAASLLDEFGLDAYISRHDIMKNFLKASVVRDVIPNGYRLTACITFERWRFLNPIQRAQLITNIAYCLETYGSLLEFSLTKQQARMLNTIFYTIEGWSGYMDANEKRSLMSTTFQRLKEREKKLIVRADSPLTTGIWL